MEQRARGTERVQLLESVFHFTSMDAMMNIVEDRALRCTAISYLNDSTERTFLLDAVRKRLPYLKQQDGSLDPSFSLQTIEVEDVHIVTPLANEAFVTSFAENGDSLMHWRSYCPQQSGIAIGFRTDCLDAADIDENPAPGMSVPPIAFGKVGYIDVGDQIAVDKVIYSAIATAKETLARNAGVRGYSGSDVNKYFGWAVNAIACTNKHQAFQIEGEHRLLLSDVRYRENNIRFRTVRSTLVPYVALRIPGQTANGLSFDKRLGWGAIDSVVIGPTANMDLTEKSVKAFFALKGMQVKVVRSKIPYRDW
jgi:mRNA-degrading endonuclease HigB of HigAB toxin-antitoxin module